MQQLTQYHVQIKNWRFLPDRFLATAPLRLTFHVTLNTPTYAFAQQRPLLLYCEVLDLELPPLTDGSAHSLIISKANTYQFVAINYPRLKLRVEVQEIMEEKVSQHQLTISEFDSISAQDFKSAIQRICTDQQLKGLIIPCFDSIINQQISLNIRLPASQSDTNCSQQELPKKKKYKRVAKYLRGIKAIEWAQELCCSQLIQTQKISLWLSLRMEIQ